MNHIVQLTPIHCPCHPFIPYVITSCVAIPLPSQSSKMLLLCQHIQNISCMMSSQRQVSRSLKHCRADILAARRYSIIHSTSCFCCKITPMGLIINCDTFPVAHSMSNDNVNKCAVSWKGNQTTCPSLLGQIPPPPPHTHIKLIKTAHHNAC